MQNELEKQKVQYLKSIAWSLSKICRELEILNNKEKCKVVSNQDIETEEYDGN